jgi:hypothetical protein
VVIDRLCKIFASADAAVMPDINYALPFKYRELLF